VLRPPTNSQESTAHLRELDTTFNSFNGLVKTLSSSIDEGKLGGSDATTQILAIKDEVQASVRSWSQDISARSTQMTEYLLDHQEEHLNVVGKVLDSTTQLLDAVITAARENIASQAMTFATSQALVTKATDAEITRLRAQNDLLTRLLTEEQTKSATLRTDLINNITSMIVGFTDSQDASLRAAVGKVNAGNDSGIEKVGAFASQHAAVIEQGSRLAASFSTNLESWSADVEGHRGQGDEVSQSCRLPMLITGTRNGRYRHEHAAWHVRRANHCGRRKACRDCGCVLWASGRCGF
jgi:kinesin family protein 11